MYTLFNVKTDYSLLSSLIKIDDLISFCNAYKIKECAICDNNLSSSIEFYTKCINNDIKPIIGLELTYKEKIITLYAKNYEGYKNLLKINTFIEKEELTEEILIKYSNYLICVLPYKSINLFQELKFYNDIFIGYKSEEEYINAKILTNNVIYYTNIKIFKKEDKEFLEVINFLGGLNNLNEITYLEKISIEKLEEYNVFYSQVNLVMPKENNKIPVFDKTKDSLKYLSTLANIGLEKRLNGNIDKTYKTRLEYELSIISDMGFTDYFLIVYDYVLYAKKNNILVGPGRGSAGGSLVCYSVGITDIDPIKYDLLFERFLNKERVDLPDIDIDFDSEKREEIIKYVQSKYGVEKVATGLTFNTLKTKSSLREVANYYKIDSILLSKFMKYIDDTKNLKDNLKLENINKFLDTYKELQKVYKTAIKLENIKVNISMHAAGIIICDRPLDEIIPVKVTDSGYITGFTMNYLENLGLLKMDFLSVKNLNSISNIIKSIGSNVLKDINLHDQKVINIFKNIETDGIFQYKTYAMKNLLQKLKPTTFDEITAAVALVRPGPSQFLEKYIENKNNINGIKYASNDLKEILQETYGIILYQEQIIKIMVKVGGFSGSEADIIRRAISKKKNDVLIKSKKQFIEGATKNGYNENVASNIFDEIALFAGFGFNKSHSVAYALIGYQMAYLKVYYNIHFINEMLNNSKEISLAENLLSELKRNNIKVIKPDVNYSTEEFYIHNNQLIMPLTMIKGVTKELAKNISASKPYSSYFEFALKHKGINDLILENIIYANALRSFKYNINTLLSSKSIIKSYTDLNGLGQEPLLKNEVELDKETLLKKELELFGFYVGNHPSSKYKMSSVTKLKNIQDKLFKNITCFVCISKIKKIKTKKGDDMAFLTVSDETGTDEVLVFKDIIKQLDDLNVNDFVKIDGKVSQSYDKIKIIASSIKKERL